MFNDWAAAGEEKRKVWTSNAGIQPVFLVSRTVKPGESITLSATWNGHSDIGPGSAVSGHVLIGSQVQGASHVKIVILDTDREIRFSRTLDDPAANG